MFTHLVRSHVRTPYSARGSVRSYTYFPSISSNYIRVACKADKVVWN